MSVYVLTHVWRNGPNDRSELLVLLALADFADDEGHCWPSIRKVADKARMSERGVQKITRRLCESGFLKVSQGGGRGGSNRYEISMKNPEPYSVNTVHPEPHSVNTGAKTPNGSAKTPNQGSPKPSRTVKEPSKDIRAILCSVVSQGVADDFIEHRKTKRAKLTVRAAELIAKDLAECHDPESAVLKSIKNGWTGVFPENPKESIGGQNDRTDGSAASAAQRAGERWAARNVDRG